MSEGKCLRGFRFRHPHGFVDRCCLDDLRVLQTAAGGADGGQSNDTDDRDLAVVDVRKCLDGRRATCAPRVVERGSSPGYLATSVDQLVTLLFAKYAGEVVMAPPRTKRMDVLVRAPSIRAGSDAQTLCSVRRR